MAEDDTPPERVESLMVGVKRWHAGVATRPGDPRHVTLTIELVDEAEMPPLTFALSAVDARKISEALQHYAGQAEQRDEGDRN